MIKGVIYFIESNMKSGVESNVEINKINGS